MVSHFFSFKKCCIGYGLTLKINVDEESRNGVKVDSSKAVLLDKLCSVHFNQLFLSGKKICQFWSLLILQEKSQKK